MTKVQTSNSNSLRSLDDSELDLVTGGVIDGCIRLPTIGSFTPIPPTSPWFDPTWIRVGRTGSL